MTVSLGFGLGVSGGADSVGPEAKFALLGKVDKRAFFFFGRNQPGIGAAARPLCFSRVPSLRCGNP